MGNGKKIISWLKNHLLRKKRKKCYETTTGSDNSKIMEKVDNKVSSKKALQEAEVHDQNQKRKKWGKKNRKGKVACEERPCTQENTAKKIRNEKRKRRGKDKIPSKFATQDKNVLLTGIHEKTEGREKAIDDDKVQSKEKPCTLQEITRDRNANKQNLKRESNIDDKVLPKERLQEITQDRNANEQNLIREKRERDIDEKILSKEQTCTLQEDRNANELQNLMRERDTNDKVLSKEQTCILQEKIDFNMDAHLLKICEQYLEKGRKGREVKGELLADPLTYGSSLLRQLPSTSDVEIRPPSRDGVGFSISSGSYRPESRSAWSGKLHQSRLSPIGEENEEAVDNFRRRELAHKLQKKMERVTQSRTAHLLGICEQNRDRDRRREEARSRRKTLHFKPPADASTSLLGNLPPISYVEDNAPPEESLGLAIESCSNQLQSWKETLEMMSEESVTEASEEAAQSVVVSGQLVKCTSETLMKRVAATVAANKVEEKMEKTCDDEFNTSLCCPSDDEALDEDPPGHRCGGVSAEGDVDPPKAGVNSESGDGKLKNIVHAEDEKKECTDGDDDSNTFSVNSLAGYTNEIPNCCADFAASSTEQRDFEDLMTKYGEDTTRSGIDSSGRVPGGKKCVSGGTHSDPSLDGRPIPGDDFRATDFDKDSGTVESGVAAYNASPLLDNANIKSSQQTGGDCSDGCMDSGSSDNEVSDCSSGDKTSQEKDEDWDFEEEGMENWDDENDVPEFDFCIYCPMHCPLHSKGSEAKAENSESGGSNEDDNSGKEEGRSDSGSVGSTGIAKPGSLASIQKQELPEKWVDTRIFPVMTDEEVMYDRKDLDLFYKRKYFIYIKDRMRSLSYNLELDGIVKNTEEHRRLKRMILKAEEEEDILQWNEMKEIEEKKKLLKKMVDKVELEKRWHEMNKGNVELWKQEQKRNERKWRVKWMKEEKRWQELEAQWEEVEKHFEEEEMAKKEKKCMATGPRPPSPCTPPEYPSSSCTGSNSSCATVEGSKNSFRRRLYRKAGGVAETNQVSAEVSANAREYLKMPPILPPIKQAPKTVLDLRGFNEEGKTAGFFLPPLANLPITCQQNVPRPQPPKEGPKYNYPKRSRRYKRREKMQEP